MLSYDRLKRYVHAGLLLLGVFFCRPKFMAARNDFKRCVSYISKLFSSRSELPVLKITSTIATRSPSYLQSTLSSANHQNGTTAAFRKQQQISSVYTQLSSIKPTTNGNNYLPPPTPSSLQPPKSVNSCKTVKTTHIGNIGSTASRICIANHKSSPELRTNSSVRTTCVGQSVAKTNGHIARH